MTNLALDSFKSQPGVWERLRTTWEARASMAAQYLSGEESVADIGCGLMSLRKYLSAGVRYVPLDVVDRGGNIVVDLNHAPLPPVDTTAASMLGVIEYLVDVDGVLSQLRSFRTVAISYNHWSLKDVTYRLLGKKRPQGWKHHMKRTDFERAIHRHGFFIEAQRRVRWGETLYRLRGPAFAIN
jgi:hypothetical protein